MYDAPSSRIIFNFGDSCNMRCPYCYVPFRSQSTEESMCRAILTRITDLGFKVVTFGGGDPFKYNFFPSLIEFSYEKGLLVHIDTNGIGIKQSSKLGQLLMEKVVLIGLPLDGITPEMHSKMRMSAHSHFDHVLATVRWMIEMGCRLKINTMVSQINVDEVLLMASLVESLNVTRWSLYQYWPLEAEVNISNMYCVEDALFKKTVDVVKSRVCNVFVERSDIAARRLTYPFVSQNGTLYVHDQEYLTEYKFIGSIFDDKAVAKTFAICSEDRPESSSRYQL